MGRIISLYPSFNIKRGDGIFTVNRPTFWYTRNEALHPLSLKDPEQSVSGIFDEDGFWSVEENNLILRWSLACRHGNRLYDYNDWDVACACRSAVIGIGIAWYSPDSRQRGANSIGEIAHSDEEQLFDAELCFNRSELRGRISFSLFLYLKDSGIPDEFELHFSNIVGLFSQALLTNRSYETQQYFYHQSILFQFFKHQSFSPIRSSVRQSWI